MSVGGTYLKIGLDKEKFTFNFRCIFYVHWNFLH